MRVGRHRLHRSRGLRGVRRSVRPLGRRDGIDATLRSDDRAENPREIPAPGDQIGDALTWPESRESDGLSGLAIGITLAVVFRTSRIGDRSSDVFGNRARGLCISARGQQDRRQRTD